MLYELKKPNIIWYVVFGSHLEYDSEKKYNTSYVIMFLHSFSKM